MNLKPLISIYSILIGLAVIAMWAVILLTQHLQEGKVALGFHLYSEFSMAVICLVSGVMLLKNMKFARETNMAGLAMVVYSTLNAAGYYGQKGETAMMVMFIALAVLSIAAICGHYYRVKSEE
jgi:hypothetical protein